MDRNGEIDFSELRVQSERIISVETQMMARVLKPRQPELLLRRLRRARTKLNDAAGLLSMIKKDAFAGKTSNTPRPGHTRSVCVRLVAKPNEATPQSIPHSITGIPYMGTVVAAKKSTIQRSLVAKPKTISLFEEAQAQTSRI
uniref:EF-hand domain-containing protein n=1 Tax=Spongospora subterranea TaxID=70186 RepID=A0A0H5QWV6_9EUKA|eukprot:CRZ06096.1 hypothetical protein [Spongospora subterranea]